MPEPLYHNMLGCLVKRADGKRCQRRRKVSASPLNVPDKWYTPPPGGTLTPSDIWSLYIKGGYVITSVLVPGGCTKVREGGNNLWGFCYLGCEGRGGRGGVPTKWDEQGSYGESGRIDYSREECHFGVVAPQRLCGEGNYISRSMF